MLAAEAPFAWGESCHEGGTRGHREVEIGQLMLRPLSQCGQLPLAATLFRAKMTADLVLGQHSEEGRQLGAAVRIEASEQFPVVGDQRVPNPGGNFIDQVRIGSAVSEQDLNRLDQPRMALLVEFFPSGHVAAETPIHELAITVRGTAFAVGNSSFSPGGNAGGIGFGFASFCHGKTPGKLGLWANFIERGDARGGASFDTLHAY